MGKRCWFLSDPSQHVHVSKLSRTRFFTNNKDSAGGRGGRVEKTGEILTEVPAFSTSGGD